MLIGNWLINLFLALTAFIIVFTASFQQNLLATTFIRSSIAFIISFLIGYLFRYLLAIASKDPTVEEKNIDNEEELRGKEEVEVEDPNLLNYEEMQLSEEDIYKTSQYVKDLLNNEEV